MYCPSLFSVIGCVPRWGLFFACVVVWSAGVRGETMSEARIDRLRQLALEAFEVQGTDAADEAIREAVLAEFAKQCEAPVPPAKDVVTREMCREKMQAMLQLKAKEKFPLPNEEELAEEAANEYPIHQVGDQVSISFRPNPVRTVKAAGEYRGRNGQFITIGSRSILIRDIRAVPGNEDELLKFFPEQAREKRRQYIARRKTEIFAQRDQWKKENRDEMLRMVLGKRTEANEARGYIRHRERWSTPETVLDRMLADLRKKAREREQQRGTTDKTDERSGGSASADGDVPQPPSEGASAVDGEADAGQTTEDAATTDADAAAADSATEVGSHGDKEDERADGGGEAADDPSLDENEATGSRAETTTGAGEDSSEAKSDGIAVHPILLVIVGGLIAVAAILCWPAKERGRYHPGTGQGSEASLDPLARFADVPHVIGRFPDRERAMSILAGVSCLSMSEKAGRELSCRWPLEYGFVPEEEGALVGFIAGSAFEYPLWREARDLMHRSRDAELLSAKPPLPDVHVPQEGAAAEAVSEVGQFEGDDHDPSCYWVFQADAPEAAKAFLKQVRVNTNGWHVVVQTPQGHWGRDARGLYQE